MQRTWIALSVGLLAVALTYAFWPPLWHGGGFVGGDLYTYYLPQKTFYADQLHAGQLPLWNPRTGHGYPFLAESQVGAFYPFHVIGYSLFEVNTAYHLNHLVHYVLAFGFTWLYARRIGLKTAGSLLTGLVYTYGWFPARSCLEWAIIGGTYLPLALWLTECFLQKGRWWPAFGLSLTLAVQMLAGHYNLAFITHLVLLIYIICRLWLTREGISRQRRKAGGILLASFVAAYALAAVQLLPTWQLKELSQRNHAAASADFDPAYGHIPPVYWSQIVAPWIWYSSNVDLDRTLNEMDTFAMTAATNQVEAHLYFGLLPVLLVIGLLVSGRFARPERDRRLGLWAILGLAALIYTSGWLVPVTQHLPGFGYFQGPGRFGIVTTLAVGILAGSALDRFGRLVSPKTGVILASLVLGLTGADLWLVSRLVTYTAMLDQPPLHFVEASPVRRILEQADEPPRVLAPGPNLVNLLDVGCVPSYLGLGPAVYFNPDYRMPRLNEDADGQGRRMATSEQITWLQQAGVTHVLSFHPLARQHWPADLLWQGVDPFLHRAWGRAPREPLYLYRLTGSRGRLAWQQTDSTAKADILDYGSDRIVIRADSQTGGRLILTDLMYPGWRVRVDGQPAQAEREDAMYRAVDLSPGRHRVVWTYKPWPVYWGAGISLATFLLLALVGYGASRPFLTEKPTKYTKETK